MRKKKLMLLLGAEGQSDCGFMTFWYQQIPTSISSQGSNGSNPISEHVYLLARKTHCSLCPTECSSPSSVVERNL